MRNVILFIAMSLDGYIADRDGGVGWLNGQGTAARFRTAIQSSCGGSTQF